MARPMEIRLQREDHEAHQATGDSMDPSMKDDLDAMTARITAAVAAAVKAAVHTALVDTNANIVDLVSWKPDLEKSSAIPTASESAATHRSATLQGKQPVYLTQADGAVFEYVMVPPTTCSTDCSGSVIGAPSPTTQVKPSRLLLAAAPALTHELKVLRPMPWPSFKYHSEADYHEESMFEPFGKFEDDDAVVKEDAQLVFKEYMKIIDPKLNLVCLLPVQASLAGLQSFEQIDTDPTLALFPWNPGSYLPRSRNQRTMLFTTARSDSHWPVSWVILESWHCSSEHVCPATVQLHILEELLDVFDFNNSQVFDTAHSEQETVMALSCQAATGGNAKAVMQLQAWLQGQEIFLLIDSGSTTSFVSTSLAVSLTGLQPLKHNIRVKVADGAELLCTQELPHCKWMVQGHEFTTSFKVLPLEHYDVILGYDWLQARSPMEVDSTAKHMVVNDKNWRVHLQGIRSEDANCQAISIFQCCTLLKQGSISQVIQVYAFAMDTSTGTEEAIPAEISQVLIQFTAVFAEPTSLPPGRAGDHKIDLIPGAQPVHLRPYRHSPELKTEIERQVQEMLDSGVSRPSTSSFSSPVILVRKKDSTWRMCIDFRHLNSLTRPTRFPIPIIDELLEELAGASWFSKLDLRAGYHQIRLAEGEEYKTAFQSGRYDCIRVMIDKFTKYAHFCPLGHPFAAAQVAQVLFETIYKLHGLPVIIVSDRDPIFTSKFWRELFSLVGIDLNMSTSNHPQTDGQSEQVNQCLEIYLRCFMHACPKRWSQWLASAEYWYNTADHSALGVFPFKTLYGYEPRQWGLEAADATPVTDAQQWIQEHANMNELLKQQLNTANQKMKHQADKKRSHREFAVGDSVFLKLQPYAQSSVSNRSNHKLSFRFFGPYNILARVGALSYRLELPDDAQVHPVFHVSQLRGVIPPYSQVSQTLLTDTDAFASPLHILETRWHKKGNTMIEQGRVQWSSNFADSPTWEDLPDLRTRFPQSPAWGQAVSQGEGSVSSPGTTTVAGPNVQGQPVPASRPRRQSKPNQRFIGGGWVNKRARPT